MLFDWIIGPVLSFMSGILGVLPTGTWSPSLNGAGAAADIGGYITSAQSFIDVGMVVQLLYLTVVFVGPAVLVYAIAQWGYRELPEIMGFGS